MEIPEASWLGVPGRKRDESSRLVYNPSAELEIWWRCGRSPREQSCHLGASMLSLLGEIVGLYAAEALPPPPYRSRGVLGLECCTGLPAISGLRFVQDCWCFLAASDHGRGMHGDSRHGSQKRNIIYRVWRRLSDVCITDAHVFSVDRPTLKIFVARPFVVLALSPGPGRSRPGEAKIRSSVLPISAIVQAVGRPHGQCPLTRPHTNARANSAKVYLKSPS